jgi:hypothetical protein
VDESGKVIPGMNFKWIRSTSFGCQKGSSITDAMTYVIAPTGGYDPSYPVEPGSCFLTFAAYFMPYFHKSVLYVFCVYSCDRAVLRLCHQVLE